MRPTLLLTRPRPQSERFAREAAGLDLPVVVAPLLEIVPLGVTAGPAEFRVFTSENAVACLGPGSGPCACVGPRTSAAAQRAGYTVVLRAPDAARLLPQLLAHRVEGRVQVLRGRHAAMPFAEKLQASGKEAEEVVLYDQAARPLTPEARALLTGAAPVMVPLFSPRTAALFAQAAAEARAPLWLAPISLAASQACPLPADRREVARTPDSSGVLEALVRLAGTRSA